MTASPTVEFDLQALNDLLAPVEYLSKSIVLKEIGSINGVQIWYLKKNYYLQFTGGKNPTLHIQLKNSPYLISSELRVNKFQESVLVIITPFKYTYSPNF